MNTARRSLAGVRVGLSISETEVSAKQGFPSWQINRATLQVAAALFGQGAGIVFGHDWREDGVMEAVHGLARDMQPPPDDGGESEPLLENILPWPDEPRLSKADREQLSATLSVEEAGLPEELEKFDQKGRANRRTPLFTYLRARGLTHQRRELEARSSARLCLGGRRGGSQGRYPGVIEEALLALENETPLYLAGLLGGATSQLIDAVEGGEMPKDFCPTKVSELYKDPPEGIREHDQGTIQDRQIEPALVWSRFRETGASALSRANGLSPKENAELFYTPVLDGVIRLVLSGLSRLDHPSSDHTVTKHGRRRKAR